MLLIAGTIGAGKSSLTDFLSKEMASKPFYENVEDNDVLPLFYSNPERYAFLLQIFFLNKSFLGMREALSNDDNVIDRSIYEDSLMFHLNADLGRIAPMEVEQYDNLLNTMLGELEESAPLKHPDLMVHMTVFMAGAIKRGTDNGNAKATVEIKSSAKPCASYTTGVSLPWTTPIGFSGYLSTGSLVASIWQFVLLAIGCLIYYPFIMTQSTVSRRQSGPHFSLNFHYLLHTPHHREGMHE